jgi:polyhydroxybutyrate depolymerase
MKRIFAALVLLMIHQAAFADSERWIGHLTVGSMRRDFRVFIPSIYNSKQKTPLVIVLHGGGGRGLRMESFTRFSELAERENFIVAYPDGYRRNWNDGREISQSRAHREKIDDVSFISSLIDAIGGRYAVDDRRIYVTGISNGGFMSMRLACELSHRIAAVAVITATVPDNIMGGCSPGSKVSVLIMNGTKDPLVPYNGGMVTFMGRERGKASSTDATVKLWIGINNCSAKPSRVEMIDNSDEDGTRVEKRAYKSKDNDGVEVVLYTIFGGGHTWPGGMQYAPERWIGKTSREIDATEVIWKFFKAHPRTHNPSRKGVH